MCGYFNGTKLNALGFSTRLFALIQLEFLSEIYSIYQKSLRRLHLRMFNFLSTEGPYWKPKFVKYCYATCFVEIADCADPMCSNILTFSENMLSVLPAIGSFTNLVFSLHCGSLEFPLQGLFSTQYILINVQSIPWQIGLCCT